MIPMCLLKTFILSKIWAHLFDWLLFDSTDFEFCHVLFRLYLSSTLTGKSIYLQICTSSVFNLSKYFCPKCYFLQNIKETHKFAHSIPISR